MHADADSKGRRANAAALHTAVRSMSSPMCVIPLVLAAGLVAVFWKHFTAADEVDADSQRYFDKMQSRFDRHRDHMKDIAAEEHQRLKDGNVAKVWLEDEVEITPTKAPTRYVYKEVMVDCTTLTDKGCDSCIATQGGGVCGWCRLAGKCVPDEGGPCFYPQNHVSLRGIGGSTTCPTGDEDPVKFWTEEVNNPEGPLVVVGVPNEVWPDEKLDAELQKLADAGKIAVSRQTLVNFFKEHVQAHFKKVEDELLGPGRAELKKKLMQADIDRHTNAVPRILTQFTIAQAHREMGLYLQQMFGAQPERMAPSTKQAGAKGGDGTAQKTEAQPAKKAGARPGAKQPHTGGRRAAPR